MTKPIEEYTADELSAKIENIKAEREKTANALKRYEEELERRNNQKWLPLYEKLSFDSTFQISCSDELQAEIKMSAGFKNRACFDKYIESLREVNKAWFANTKGEPIDIKVLLPLLPEGKVYYSYLDKRWKLVDKNSDVRMTATGFIVKGGFAKIIEPFNIKPAEDWRNSLMECGL